MPPQLRGPFDDQSPSAERDGMRSPLAKNRSGLRTAAMLIVGLLTGAGAAGAGFGHSAPVFGWIVASLIYTTTVWARTHKLTPEQTANHATTEDPSRPIAELLILLASIASIGAVAGVILSNNSASGSTRYADGALVMLSLSMSWVLVNTLYMLRYASEFYRQGGAGVDFGEAQLPAYSDFAYLAFTIGMTYQTSDTRIRTSRLRAIVLPHALLSYVFGAVILASTINLIVGLANR